MFGTARGYHVPREDLVYFLLLWIDSNFAFFSGPPLVALNRSELFCWNHHVQLREFWHLTNHRYNHSFCSWIPPGSLTDSEYKPFEDGVNQWVLFWKLSFAVACWICCKMLLELFRSHWFRSVSGAKGKCENLLQVARIFCRQLAKPVAEVEMFKDAEVNCFTFLSAGMFAQKIWSLALDPVSHGLVAGIGEVTPTFWAHVMVVCWLRKRGFSSLV